MAFTTIVDLDREIFMKLSDRDLLTACATDKYTNTKVCNDDFYRKRTYNNYRELFDYLTKLPNFKDWRNVYLNWIYILDESKIRNIEDKVYNINYAIRLAIQRNNPILLEYLDKFPPKFMLEKTANYILDQIKWDDELINSLLGEQFDIVKYILVNKKLDIITLNTGLSHSVRNNNLDLANLFLEKGANLTNAVSTAAQQGNIPLMKYFAEMGTVNWEVVEKNLNRGILPHQRLKTNKLEEVKNYILLSRSVNK